MRGAAVLVLAAWLAVVILNVQPFRDFDLRYWFFYDDSYSAIGEPAWWAGLLRLGLIVVALVLSAAVFALIPRRRTWLTPFGQATMYVYLLHSFVLYPIRETGVLDRRAQLGALAGQHGARGDRDLHRPGQPPGAPAVPATDRAESALAVQGARRRPRRPARSDRLEARPMIRPASGAGSRRS